MGLLKMWYYYIKVKCTNCGKECDIKIKKGVSVAEAITNETIKCDNCGCLIKPNEYSTTWLK